MWHQQNPKSHTTYYKEILCKVRLSEEFDTNITEFPELRRIFFEDMGADDLIKLLDYELIFFQVDRKLESHMHNLTREQPYLSNSFNVLCDIIEQPYSCKVGFDINYFIEHVKFN